MSMDDYNLYLNLLKLAETDVYQWGYKKEYREHVLFHPESQLTIRIAGLTEISVNHSQWWTNWVHFGFLRNFRIVNKFKKLIKQYHAIGQKAEKIAEKKEKEEKCKIIAESLQNFLKSPENKNSS